MELTELHTPEDLNGLLERSHQRLQLIFKHSLTCPVSFAAQRALKNYLAKEPSEAVDYSWIAIQNSKPVSAAVVETLGVQHESPQALLVASGKVLWNDSHFAITASALKDAISQNLG